MRAERLTDEDMKKFEMPARQPRPNQRPVSNREWGLTASWGYPPKTIGVSFPVWADIVRLVEKYGFRFPDANGGLGRELIPLFTKSLTDALSKGGVDDELREVGTRVLDFVEGAGKGGFKMMSRFTR
jgi:hypothetical protein